MHYAFQVHFFNQNNFLPLQTLSEAMKVQAEATCQLSNAVDSIARSEERQTKLMTIIFKLLHKDT